MQFISGESIIRRSRLVHTVAAPAAGADWSVKVPGGVVWHPVAITATLTTAVAVANRLVRLQATNGTTTLLDVPASAVQAASLAYVYAFIDRGSAYAAGTSVAAAVPELYLPSGFVLKAKTDNLQAADQWSAVELYVIETMVERGPIDVRDAAELNVVVLSAPEA